MTDEGARERAARRAARLAALASDPAATASEALEAACAMQRVMARWGVSPDAGGGDGAIASCPAGRPCGRRAMRTLAHVTASGMRCRVFFRGGGGAWDAVFYGRGADARAAASAYRRLADAMDALCKREAEAALGMRGYADGAAGAAAAAFVLEVRRRLAANAAALALRVPPEVDEGFSRACAGMGRGEGGAVRPGRCAAVPGVCERAALAAGEALAAGMIGGHGGFF